MVALLSSTPSTASLNKAAPKHEWAKGSVEEVVQNAIKSWEMELSHKTRIQDFRTINPDKFKLIVNGREGLSAEETLRLGSYNALLKSSMPEEFKYYKVEEESFESSHTLSGRPSPVDLHGRCWPFTQARR
ncbi:UNVERIFIED_CONTAM: Pathogen-related protein [Sesamum calycinum]|uniref:Pathogen-related protein n=1 Tax=Sesamum calycinum TaxID=2727403 RepID=A0AAW2J650_9LAMI